ncbi:MAG: DUF6513 domain-containing protein [Candidatus Altiarchaeota archaeon]
MTMMKKNKILLVTGKNAEKGLREILKENKIFADIHVCDIEVASFITPEILMKEFSEKNLSNFNKIILPGKVKGDFSVIEKKFKIKVVKGPESFLEIPRFMKKTQIGKPLNFYKFSHIIAEIVDAPKLTEKELIERAKYYEASGADIIDIGMVANEDNSEKIEKIIKILRKNTKLKLSIDTLNENEILSASESGIDLIISLDISNYKIAKNLKVPFVMIPRDENGFIAKKAIDRITIVERLMEKLKQINKNFIVDLILDPLGVNFSESLKAFILFREKYPNVRMMMGIGNVTELIDADSVGINALLVGIASELNIEFLLTTEASNKTKNSVSEVSKAVKMMQAAKTLSQSPKDLGIDLLILKDKEKLEFKFDDLEKVQTIVVKKKKKEKLEKNFFRIFIYDSKINVLLYENLKRIPKMRFIGKEAIPLYQEILSKNLVKSIEHAAYLGKELAKAEIALKLGKNYIQDENLFPSI